jgi:small subunit ribosomal protein S16
MVKIRLSRAGAKKRPYYHIIAIDERRRRDGRPLARLGTYDPGQSDAPLTIDLAGIETWVGKGAQLSDTVASLVRKGRKAAAVAQPAAAAAPAPEGA